MRKGALPLAALAGVLIASLSAVPAPARTLTSDRTAAVAETQLRRAPLSGVIYYTWRCDLFTIAPNGRDRQQLTTGRPCEGRPMVSPDGTSLAYRRVNLNSGSFGLSTLDLSSGTTHRLPHTTNASWVRWSPDSTRLSYDVPAGKKRYEVRIVKADGSGQRVLRTGFKTAYTALWSRDGKRIYFTTDAEAFRSNVLGCSYAPSAIYSVGIHGGHRRLERGSKRLDSYPTDVIGRTLISSSSTMRRDSNPRNGCLPQHVKDVVYVGKKAVLGDAWYATLSPDRTHLLFEDRRHNKLAISTVGGRHRHAIPNAPRSTYGTWGMIE